MSSGKYRKEHDCLNCGQQVEKHYCSSCGQPNIEVNESFWGFISHSIAHYFHFDNKFFKTLKPLLTQPGQVTLDYLAGKRARYINPVSMYIFVSIVYFLIVPHALESGKHESDDKKAAAVSLQKPGKLNGNIDNLKEILPDAATERLKGAINGEMFEGMTLTDQKRYVDSLLKTNAKIKSDSLREAILNYQQIILDKEESTSYDAYMARQRSLPEAERDNWFQRYKQKKQIAVNSKKAEGNFDLQAELKKYQPKQYFLLMPLLAFFIMLNFRKNHIYYLHHLIFTIHGMTAYFIISIIAEPIKAYLLGHESFLSNILGMLVTAGTLWYLYTGLSVFYNRSRSVTIRKTIMVIFLYVVSLSLSAWVVKQAVIYMLA
jgi:hypothetical protein